MNEHNLIDIGITVTDEEVAEFFREAAGRGLTVGELAEEVALDAHDAGTWPLAA